MASRARFGAAWIWASMRRSPARSAASGSGAPAVARTARVVQPARATCSSGRSIHAAILSAAWGVLAARLRTKTSTSTCMRQPATHASSSSALIVRGSATMVASRRASGTSVAHSARESAWSVRIAFLSASRSPKLTPRYAGSTP